MKGLIKYGLVAAMVFATAMPAMAASWVVCIDENKDFRPSTQTVGSPPTLSSLSLPRPFIPATLMFRLQPTAHQRRSARRRSVLSLRLAAWLQACRNQLPQIPTTSLRSCGISGLPTSVTLTPQGPFVRRPPTTKSSPARPILVWCLTRALR